MTSRFVCLLFCLSLFSCQPGLDDLVEEPTSALTEADLCGIGGVTNVQVYHRDGRVYLYGGQDPATHFDVTDFSLEFTQLKDYGYHRETFKALIEPSYIPASQASSLYQADEPVIWLQSDEGLKLFPYTLMTYHEVINEQINGTPVMIAYCFLADLAAVYSREYCGHTLTFAVSGYTYSDPHIWEGKDGFVLWDRDTESLWWPLMNRAVSGDMNNTLLKEYDQKSWGLSTFGDFLTAHPEAWVLENNQPWEPPVSWERLDPVSLDCN